MNNDYPKSDVRMVVVDDVRGPQSTIDLARAFARQAIKRSNSPRCKCKENKNNENH